MEFHVLLFTQLPFTYLINESFNSENWFNGTKVNRAVTIKKKNDKRSKQNYQPASNPPIFLIVFGNTISKIIQNYLYKYNFPNKSTGS